MHESPCSAMEEGTAVHTRTALRAFVLAVAAAVVAVYVLVASVPPAALTLPLMDRASVKALVPEGWAFFTKSPLTPSPRVYLRDSAGQWNVSPSGPLAVPADAFGLNRTLRARGTEVALLLQNVEAPASWQTCTKEVTACLPDATALVTVRNPEQVPTICGQVAFVQQKTLPWAWRNTETIMPSQFLVAQVQC